MVLAPHFLHLLFVCGKTLDKEKFSQTSEKIRNKTKQSYKIK